MEEHRLLPDLDAAEEDRVIQYLVDKFKLRPADECRHLLGPEIDKEAYALARRRDEQERMGVDSDRPGGAGAAEAVG